MKTCISTIIKNEQEYIDEFIQYHLNLGIDCIFLFEDIDSNSHKDIISKYPLDKVRLFNIVDTYDESVRDDIIFKKKLKLYLMQKRYIKSCLRYIKDNYDFDWCFVIDCDEYITLEDNTKTLSEVMTMFNDYEAIVIDWENYGNNNIIFKPDYTNKGLIDTYTKIAGNQKSDRPMAKTKCAYNMNLYNYEDAKNLHIEEDYSMKWCRTDFSQDIPKTTYKNLYLRHYITKSWEEYVWKVYVRGMFYTGHRQYDTFFEINEDMIPRKDELMGYVDTILKKYQQ
jgi:hypothetical protein